MSRAKPVMMIALLLSAAGTGGCGTRRPPEAVARELVETAEELAGVFESARTIEDLRAQEDRLRRIVRRAPQLRTEARRAGEIPSEVRGTYQARWDKAVRRIIAARAAWIRAGKSDMLEFVDELK